MTRIAVTESMGQVATSLIERAGRAFEIVLLGRAYSCSRIALLFLLGRGGQRRCLHRRRALSREQNLAASRLEASAQVQAAVAARHVRNASSRKTRSVRRDVRWRWTLNVLWTAA